MSATQQDLLTALRKLHKTGIKHVSAGFVAELLWPDSRRQNANGQVFHLSAGAAGRMLRRCHAVREYRNRIWEILPHRLQQEPPQ